MAELVADVVGEAFDEPDRGLVVGGGSHDGVGELVEDAADVVGMLGEPLLGKEDGGAVGPCRSGAVALDVDRDRRDLLGPDQGGDVGGVPLVEALRPRPERGGARHDRAAMRSSSAWTAGGPARMSPDKDVVGAGPVGDGAAGLPDQDGPSGDVPRAEGQFEEPVEHAGRHPRQVERGGPGPSQVLEPLERRVQRPVVAGQDLLVPEREARPDDGADRRSAERRGAARWFRRPVRRWLREPAAAAYVSRRNGAWTTPTVGLPSSTSATETATIGNPCRKLVVPSRGSTSQYRSDVIPPRSSPTSGMSGVASAKKIGDRSFARPVDDRHVVTRALLFRLARPARGEDRRASDAGRPGGERTGARPASSRDATKSRHR